MTNKSNIIFMLMAMLPMTLAICNSYVSSDTNWYYSLANLSLGESEAYTSSPLNATRYTFNLCAAVTAFSTTANCNPPDGKNYWSAYQLVTGPTNYCNPWGEYGGFKITDGLNGPASGVTFTLINARTNTYPPCKDGNTRKLIIFVACDPNARKAVVGKASNPTTNCVQRVNMTSSVACPVPNY
eukprot:TRINITY_DN88_c0_g1_i2.p1 TRINITY_DN88_c0_g1~~TRINITY_DN88_c0_g1_i2.p1  ORF type:complete len:184 (+),score=15.94 TRINITY_DN88_c0_g1_i2:113-664(+)